MTTPAGWFRDLDNPDLERYWDGSRWTDRTQNVQGNAGSLHPSERYTYDTTSYSAADSSGDRTSYQTERVGTHDTSRPVEQRTSGATPVEEKRSFNPLWLLLPLLLLLGLWLAWNAMSDDDDTNAPTTTTTSTTTGSTVTESPSS